VLEDSGHPPLLAQPEAVGTALAELLGQRCANATAEASTRLVLAT
jgi:hypothetical protein